MIELLTKSIVRIRGKADRAVGVGFLVGNGQILTCAHVIRDALKLGKTTPYQPPQDEIPIDFPFLPYSKKITAKVIYWGPSHYEESNDCEYDIAGLELNTFPHPDSAPVPLNDQIPIDDLREHNFSTYGLSTEKGCWAYGKVKNKRANRSVQLDAEKVTGKLIEGGFSGAPVWDDELGSVIGMISTADDKRAGTKTAFMISTQAIMNVWSELQRQTDNTEYIDIPIVIVAMTKSEAEELIYESSSEESFSKFQRFREYFTQEDIEEWLSHYQEFRKNWQPYNHSDRSVYEIVCDMIWEINNWNASNLQLIRPKFAEKFFIQEDEDIRDEICCELTQSGGIVVVDVVSLFHPTIRKIFSQSSIDSHEKVAIIGITPLSLTALEANSIVEEEIQQGMWRAYSRFRKNFDTSCEFGVSNLHAIERWLFNVLQTTAKTTYEYKSNLKNCKKFRRQSMKKKHGIGRAIFGGIAK